MRGLYTAALHLLVLLSLLRKRSRKVFGQKWGRGIVPEGEGPLIWIHAVSLGETKTIIPLARRLLRAHPTARILFTTGTETGHEEGKRAFKEAVAHLFLPFDLPYVITPFVKRLRPTLVLLVETDFWAHWQRACKEVGASLMVVNGKISERSFRRHRAFPLFTSLLLDSIDQFCVQDAQYAERFRRLTKQPVIVTGNLKIDGDVPPPLKREELGLQREDLVLTCGSTHPGEESRLLGVVEALWQEGRAVKVILVPRHPERFDQVAAFLKERGVGFSRMSSEGGFRGQRVLLFDVMGKLRPCYGVADVAFVGGSFVEAVGGHNVLEPAFYGVPVLFGPFMHGQPEFKELALRYGAGLQVDEETLGPTLRALLMEPLRREALGAGGRRLLAEEKGALARTEAAIEQLLNSRKSPSVIG